MNPNIPDASEGKRPSASHLNEIRDAACREITGAVAQSGPFGTVIPIFSGQEVALFQLTGDPELDASSKEYKATAKPCVPNAVGGVFVYTMRATARAITIWFPAGSRNDDSEPAGPPSDVTGSRVWTTVSYGRRVVLGGGGGGLTPRILYDDVAPGDTDKNAWPVKADMTADTDADKVLVQNIFDGTYRGFGTNHTGFTPSPTAKVWTSIGTDGKEHIVCGQGMAKRCKCQLTGALVATDASCSVDTVTPTDGGQNPVSNSTSATLTVYIQRNPSSSGGFAGADNTVMQIEWHEDDDKWYIYDGPCSA